MESRDPHQVPHRRKLDMLRWGYTYRFSGVCFVEIAHRLESRSLEWGSARNNPQGYTSALIQDARSARQGASGWQQGIQAGYQLGSPWALRPAPLALDSPAGPLRPNVAAHFASGVGLRWPLRPL